ncbi:hypothetical protein Tco_1028750 [Tanacetum coccineum]|uniref:DUF4219 domain-containing protein n=1 Tax=Tanacetum coccineum TaxID=301880 RepID=A0ABQ5G1Y1_9ASTR
MMKETPYKLLKDDQKKKIVKNNETNLTLYNALPRKEYEQVFMCKSAKEVWHTLIITHQRNSQVKDCKIDLLIHRYEKFLISSEGTIDIGFTRFNAIVTSLKSLDQDYSSKNHVYEMILENDGVDSKTTIKEKVKSLNEEEAEAFNLIAKNFCKLFRKNNRFGRGNRFDNRLIDLEEAVPKENKAFVRKAESDSEDGDEPQNDATCLMAIDSQDVLWQSTLKRINELELEVKNFAKAKEVIEPCQKCVELTQKVDSLKSNVSKLQDEALNFLKFKKSIIVLDDSCDHRVYLHERVEFQRISLTGFRSCTSRSYYRSVSKQTTRYPCEASHGHKIEN